MGDQFLDNPPVREKIKVKQPSIEVASRVMLGPNSQKISDRAVAMILTNGQGGLIVAIDGKEPYGGIVAEIVQQGFLNLGQQMKDNLNREQVVDLLESTLSDVTKKLSISILPKKAGNSNTDVTIHGGIICESPGKRLFLSFNVGGDSNVYGYRRANNGGVSELTFEQLEEQGASVSPLGERATDSLKPSINIKYGVIEIEEGDIFLAVSKGLNKQGLLKDMVSDFNLARKRQDLSSLARNIVKNSRYVNNTGDICVTVLRVPEAKKPNIL